MGLSSGPGCDICEFHYCYANTLLLLMGARPLLLCGLLPRLRRKTMGVSTEQERRARCPGPASGDPERCAAC
jgi:hypothetical protein